MSKQKKLVPLCFQPLPLGSIRPTGWLLDQLRIQANGLSGYLVEFWPDIAESGWIGGTAEGWERGPYWLDGAVPLAFLLDDEKLMTKVHEWMDYILTHQHDDGWLGPIRDRSGKYQGYDAWPVFVALKAMTQYQEATNDDRVVPVMEKFFRKLDELLDENPLFVWGKSRWADLVLSIHWLYEKIEKDWLLELAAKVHAQGYDWRNHFENFQYKNKMKAEECNQTTHVVNNAMAVKSPGVWFRQSQDLGDRSAVFKILETLDEYHGQIAGTFTGDEHYAGKNPSQGTELCAVVEYMFSLENLISILGDTRLADRLERIAFNALPATFKPDMWAHQYDQQANQVICKVSEDRIYTNNGPHANIFGLEPNYGCCTANMHQGWPKFASHLWMSPFSFGEPRLPHPKEMKNPDNGIVAVAYAPSTLTTEIDGTTVQIDLNTDYPFDDTLHFTVKVDRSVNFPLYLRIPSWTKKAVVSSLTGDIAGNFYKIDREWDGETTLTLRFPMQVKTQRRYHNSISIERGPLVYSLKIGEDWKLIGGEPPHGDWEIYPTTPWNYALQIDTDRPGKSIEFVSRPVGDCPFSPDGAPIVAKVMGKQISEWKIEHNAAGALPESPVELSDQTVLEELRLIPYGSTNLRVTEFPLLEK